MILEFGPEAPWILQVLAALALVLHIGGGAMGILSGFAAMFARKGGRLHRVSGTVFFVAMLCMTGVATIVAPMLEDGRWTNTTAAIFTLYMIATAWAVARRPPGQLGRFERVVVALPVGISVMGLALVPYGAATGRMEGFATIYIFAVVCALAAVSDVRMIRRGGVTGRDRTVRHLWRMGTALFMASGSFFFGQQDRIPAAILATPIPVVLGLAPLGLMAFWWLKTRLPHGLKLRLAAS